MKYIFYIILFFNSFNSFSQIHEDTIYYKFVIQKLTSKEFKGRPSGGELETKTLDFIKQEIKNSKCKIAFQEFSYLDIDSNKLLKSHNIYSIIDNKKDSTIIIGAHYDHLGFSQKKSSDIRKKGFHPGADDNASGVALVLNLLKKKNIIKNKKYNYLFVFYGAHEQGLFGSTAFYDTAVNNFKIKLVINFDMVGRMINNIAYVFTNTNTNMKNFENNIQINNEGCTKLNELDTKRFSENKIQCISFTTGLHSDYHSVNDIESKINYLGIYEINNMIIQFLKNL